MQLKKIFLQQYKTVFSKESLAVRKSPELNLLFLYLKGTLIFKLHFESGVDRDRLFFIDIMARSLLLQTCLAQLKSEFPAEKLPALKAQMIDKWPMNCNMGNIDDLNEETFANWDALELQFDK